MTGKSESEDHNSQKSAATLSNQDQGVLSSTDEPNVSVDSHDMTNIDCDMSAENQELLEEKGDALSVRSSAVDGKVKAQEDGEDKMEHKNTEGSVHQTDVDILMPSEQREFHLSYMDLQARSEMGADFDFTGGYVHQRGFKKYKRTLKTFIPIRPNCPKEILPISSMGCLNFITYGWVTSIVWKIYRKGIDIIETMRLKEEDAAEYNAARLERLWNKELKKRGPEKASFQRVILQAFRTRLICTFIFMSLFVAFSLLNPIFLIRLLLEYLSKGDVVVSVGLAYVAGMVACELLRAVTISLSWMVNYHAGLKVRAGAMSLLFQKILRLKGMKEKTVGELVNLVGNDGQRIFEAISVGPLVFGGPVAMTAGCIYAVYYLGPWALVGCGVFVAFYPFSTYITRKTSYLRRKAILVTDRRVRMMSELLTCIKLIKMYAWETPFARQISDIRLQERKVLERSAFIQSISTATAVMVPIMASALTFIAMVAAGNDLTAAQAFSFISLLNAMRFVLGVLPYGIKALGEVTVAMNRYKSVLLMEEMSPHKGPTPKDNILVEFKDATLSWSILTIPSTSHHPSPDKGSVEQIPHRKDKRKRNIIFRKKTKGETKKMLQDKAFVNANHSVPEMMPLLRNITFSLEKGKLLGVCGSVGCGKSSMISALLGRMDHLSGSVGVKGSIAYVPQQAWIMNASARENILFGLPYNAEKYKKVVEVCALQTDFDALVMGDLTEIGERGINLSGGQKQRISLARAVYSNSDLYLLDDPLSAVDIHVGRHIFMHCILGALAGKTIIFVTHQLQYLNQCQEIMFMKDGCIVEKGSHDQLMAHNGEYAALIKIFYTEQSTEPTQNPVDDVSGSVRPELERIVSVRSGTSSATVAGSQTRVVLERAASVSSYGSKTEITDRPNENSGKLIMEEERQNGFDGRVVLEYMKAAGGLCLSLATLFVFLLTVASMNSANVFLTYWLNQGSGNTSISVGNESMISFSISDHPSCGIYTMIYGLICLLMIVLLVFRAAIFMKVTLKAASCLHDDVFEKVLHCPMTFFDSTPLGRIVNRFSSDMDEVDARLPQTAEVFLSNILHVVFSLGLIGFVAPYFLVALVPLFIAFLIIFSIFTRTMRELKRTDMMTRSPLLSHVTATVQGIATIHAYKKTDHFFKKYCDLLNKNSIPFVMFFISNRWLALRLDLISAAVTAVTALIIVLMYETITPAMAGLALSSALQMTGLFQFTIRLAIETEARFVSVQRVLEYSKTVSPEAARIIPDKRPASGWPSAGLIKFINVQMRYRDGLPLVLKKVTFRIKPQEKIGIVGRSGSGKSSLGVALFRLVELAGGSIVIDDVDISTIGLEDLRSKLAIIPQDPVLFVGTVRYNLDPFSQHSDQDLWTCLEKCHIKDAIAALEQQLEAPVVENGENFSVGERQLLCMARALLRHSKILMLDEATAAIDTETDALVQATLKGAFWDCTMLIIAHRLNTVLSCDKILVMDDGKVAEFDKPAKLMAQPQSIFRKMLEASENNSVD